MNKSLLRCIRSLPFSPDLNRVLPNAGWLIAERAIRLPVGLLVLTLMARYLGPEQFGSLNLAIAFAGLWGVIGTLGLPIVIVRDLVQTPNRREEILGTALTLQFVASVCVVVLASVSGLFLYGKENLIPLLILLASTVSLFRISDCFRFWFESQIRSKPVAVVDAISFFIASGIRIVLVLMEAPLLAFGWVLIIEAALVAFGLLLVYERKGGSLSKLRFRLSTAKSLLSHSWPLILSGLAITLYMRIDQAMLGYFVGSEAVGIYTSAVRISEFWYFIPLIIVTSYFPAILNVRTSEPDFYLRRLQKLYTALTILATVVASIITVFSMPLIKLLFGDEYTAAAPVLSIHVWSGILVVLGSVSGRWLVAENLQKLSMYRTALGAFINVCLNIYFIPNFGEVGAATATLLSYFIAVVAFDYFIPALRPSLVMKIKALTFRI